MAMSRCNLLILAVAVLTAAQFPVSAASKEERRIARLLAAYTNQVKASGEKFAASRDQLARARLSNINRLQLSATETENENGNTLRVWAIAGDSNRFGLFQGVLEATNEAVKQQIAIEILQREQEQNVKEATSKVRFQSKKLADTAKALGDVATKPNLKGRLTFLRAFVLDVRSEIQAAEEATVAAAEQGVSDAEKIGALVESVGPNETAGP